MDGMDPTTDLEVTVPAGGEAGRGSRWWTALLAGGTAVVVLAVAIGLLARGGDGDAGGRPEPLPLVAGGAAGATGGFVEGEPMIYPGPRVDYDLAGPLPDLGADAPVARLVTPPADPDVVARLAAGLGLTDATVEPTPSGWQATAATGTVMLDDFGGGWSVSFSPGTTAGGGAPGSTGSAGTGGGGAGSEEPAEPAGPDEPVSPDEPAGDVVPGPPPEPPEPPADLPGEAEAEQVARALLGDLGLLDGDWVAEVTDSGTVGIATACPEGADVPDASADCQASEQSWVTGRSVTFTRVLDGVRVNGWHWWVELGDRAAVQGVYGLWAEAEPVGAYPLRPTTEVWDEFARGESPWPGPVPLGAEPAIGAAEPAGDGTGPGAGTPVTVTITGAALGAQVYPGSDGGRPVAYAVPTYRFSGTLDGADATEIELLALDPDLVVPADAAPPPAGDATEPGGATEPAEPPPADEG